MAGNNWSRRDFPRAAPPEPCAEIGAFHLPLSMTSEMLQAKYERFGPIKTGRTRIVKAKTRDSDPFGFFEFERMEDAVRCWETCSSRSTNPNREEQDANDRISIDYARQRFPFAKRIVPMSYNNRHSDHYSMPPQDHRGRRFSTPHRSSRAPSRERDRRSRSPAKSPSNASSSSSRVRKRSPSPVPVRPQRSSSVEEKQLEEGETTRKASSRSSSSSRSRSSSRERKDQALEESPRSPAPDEVAAVLAAPVASLSTSSAGTSTNNSSNSSGSSTSKDAGYLMIYWAKNASIPAELKKKIYASGLFVYLCHMEYLHQYPEEAQKQLKGDIDNAALKNLQIKDPNYRFHDLMWVEMENPPRQGWEVGLASEKIAKSIFQRFPDYMETFSIPDVLCYPSAKPCPETRSKRPIVL